MAQRILTAARIADHDDATDLFGFTLPWCAFLAEIAETLQVDLDTARKLRANAKGTGADKRGSFVIFYRRNEPICVGAWHEP